MYRIIILCFSYLATWLPFLNKPFDWLIDWLIDWQMWLFWIKRYEWNHGDTPDNIHTSFPSITKLSTSCIYQWTWQTAEKSATQAFITRYWGVRTASTWMKSTKLHITKKPSHSGDPVSVHPVPCLATGTTVHVNGVGTNFGVGVGEARPEEPRAGGGVIGKGTASPSPPTRGFAGAL